MYRAEATDGKCSSTDHWQHLIICYKHEEVDIPMNVRKEISRGLVCAGNCEGESGLRWWFSEGSGWLMCMRVYAHAHVYAYAHANVYVFEP